jgi:nucleotide-binding universal stress UspA family protein
MEIRMIKTILVPLSGTASDEAALSAALQLSETFVAHIECIRVAPDIGQLAARSVQPDFDEDGSSGSDTLPTLQRDVEQASTRAKAHFDAICHSKLAARSDAPHESRKPSAAFRIEHGNTKDVISTLARFHDLVVATTSTGAALDRDELGGVLLECGRPVFLAPAAIPSQPIENVAIAWKITAQAARAVTAAMPFLHQARQIEVLISNEENSEALDCLDCTDSVVQQLRWHGLHAQARYVIPGGRTAPNAVVETARELGADLLVMGAYGHSRLRETIFGGFTKRILEGVDVPVLLSH